MTFYTHDVDVLIASDLRLPGGTSHSIAQEVEAQHGAGFTTALAQLNSPLSRRVRAINPAVAAHVREGRAELVVDPGARTRAGVVVLRHPTVLESARGRLPKVDTEHVLVIANSGPEDGNGRQLYDVDAADRAAHEHFGVAPTWAPIGPLIRDALAGLLPEGRVAPTDWVNIIDVDAWWSPSTDWHADRPVVGRHSRQSAQKWPADGPTIEAVYPTDGSWQVRVLGGARPVGDILGRVPASWDVLPFGAVPPREFLAGLDFFLYYYDERFVEAFGRTVLEALATGVPAVLPPRMEALFGEAALYAEPQDVRSVVDRLRSSREDWTRQRDRAGALVRERFGYEAHTTRLRTLLGAEKAPASAAPSESARPTTAGASARTSSDETRVLLMSSNGAGMGHLTRLLSYAGRLTDGVEPHVLSMSQAAPVAGRFGYPYEYLPSAKALAMPPHRWQQLYVDRVLETIERVRPRVVVFDGTWPYHGTDTVREATPDLAWVWSRRGMWREGMNADQLKKAAWFDHVIEPGEFAAPYDAGLTTTAESHRLRPVTLLDTEDLWDRAEARKRLGLPADGPLALVSLGAGNINDTRDQIGAATAALRSLGVGVCVTVPQIAEQADRGGGSDVHLVRDFPLSRAYRAFDVAIAASGYNSYHELLRFGVPTLFVPNTATSLDDQQGRARYAADQGWAHAVDDFTVAAAEPLLSDLMERGTKMVGQAEAQDPGNGAYDAATVLLALARGEAL